METRGTGAIKSPFDLRNYKLSKKACASAILPERYELYHSHIKDQGIVNSCVAHSLSEILEANTNENFSTDWIYGYRPLSYYQGQGMYISEALKTLRKVGCLKNNELNTNTEMNTVKEIVDKNLDNYKTKANDFKIMGYAYLSNIQQIKQALYTNQMPIILSINIGQKLDLDENNIAYISNAVWGLHAVVCYGWNENGLLIQNSWGENWGNKGTFILPYEYPIEEAWMIETTKNSNTSLIKKPFAYILRDCIMSIINFVGNLLSK